MVRTSILAPAYKLLGDYRIRFERSLIAAVIFLDETLRDMSVKTDSMVDIIPLIVSRNPPAGRFSSGKQPARNPAEPPS